MEIDMVCVVLIKFAINTKQETIENFFDENENSRTILLDEHA